MALVVAVDLLAIEVAASCMPVAAAFVVLLLEVAHSAVLVAQWLVVWHCAPRQTCQWFPRMIGCPHPVLHCRRSRIALLPDLFCVEDYI